MTKLKQKLLTVIICTAVCLCATFFVLGLSACGEKVKEYTVNFDMNGGVNTDENLSQTVKQGEALTAPAEPSRGGYVFVGWAKDEGGTAPWIFSADRVQSEMTLYAVWAKLYTVTLDANGGSFSAGATVKEQKLSENSLVTVPSAPQREGYKLTGWAYDVHGSRAWELNQNKVAGDVTLYAVWAKKYDIIFNANGGEFETAPTNGEPVKADPESAEIIGYKYIYAHGDYLAEIAEPVKDNFIFKGWYTALADGKKWDFETSTVDGGLTLFARWEEAYQDYEVTYKLNYEGAVDVVQKTENGLAVYEPEARKGYSFNGWWYGTEVDGNLTLTERYDVSERLGQNTTLYADWIDETQIIKVLAPPQVTRDGAVFTWQAVEGAVKYTVQVRSGSTVLNTFSVTDTQWTFSASSKYEAGVNYGVYINAVGNNVNTVTSGWASSSYQYRTLAPTKISFDTTANELSWTSVDGAAGYKLYLNGVEITDDLKKNSYDMNAYDAGTYSVKVEAVAPYNYQSSQTSATIVKYKILKPEVTIIMDEDKTAYTLTVGEVEKADVFIIEINGENYRTVKKDDKFTSDKLSFEFAFTDTVWKDGKFDLKVRAENSGSYFINSEENEITVAQPVNVNLAVEGASGTVSFDGKTFNTLLSETTSYKVTFDLNGGSGTVSEQTVTADNPLVYPSVKPARSGYVFRGWFTTPECKTVFDFAQNLNKDMTLYAGWQVMHSNSTERNLNNSYNQSMTITKGEYSYMYYAAYKSGKVKFTFSLSKITHVVYAVRNVTQDLEIGFVLWNTSYTSYTMEVEVEAGEVIYVAAMLSTNPYVSVPNSLTFYSQVTDVNGGAYDNNPLSGGTIEDGYVYAEEKDCTASENILMAGWEITLKAEETLNGKKFAGWYADGVCISDKAVVTVKPEEDETYTAVYEDL